MATSPNEDFDDDMTEATATVDLDSVRPTYTTDEVKRMQFTLIVNHNRRSLDGQFVGVTARWYVSLDNQEIGLGVAQVPRRAEAARRPSLACKSSKIGRMLHAARNQS